MKLIDALAENKGSSLPMLYACTYRQSAFRSMRAREVQERKLERLLWFAGCLVLLILLEIIGLRHLKSDSNNFQLLVIWLAVSFITLLGSCLSAFLLWIRIREKTFCDTFLEDCERVIRLLDIDIPTLSCEIDQMRQMMRKKLVEFALQIERESSRQSSIALYLTATNSFNEALELFSRFGGGESPDCFFKKVREQPDIKPESPAVQSPSIPVESAKC